MAQAEKSGGKVYRGKVSVPPLLLLLLVLTFLPTPLLAADSNWPTLHKDYQRSGYTDEIIEGPFERKWYRGFHEEMIGPRVEAIVADGLCFVGTYAGNLHALNVADGSTAWTYRAGGPIGHSPCWHDGKLYVCSEPPTARDAVDAYNSGSLACLDAKDGKEIWKYKARAGIWNSPACDGKQVYVGDRGGTFHAVDAATGVQAWTFQTGSMILKPASFSPDGQRIVFGSEDMHVYCLSPDGKLLWKSAKLPGLSLRDGAPTVWDGKVVVRTNPAKPFHEALREGGRVVCDIQRNIPLDDREDRVIVNTPNMYFVRRTDRREKAEYEGVLKYLEEHPHSRTWFTLNLDDGKEPWIATVMYTAGMHNPPTPPAFNPETNELYTIATTALGVYCSGVNQVGIGIGRIDPKTGYLTNVAHAYADREPGYFSGMPMIADETSAVGLMGRFLVVTHMGAVGGVDLKTREIRKIGGVRDTYGGIFGPGVHGSWDGSRQLARQGYVQNTVNEWHGPDRSPVAIAAGRMFWVVGGQVVCLAGPDVPATDTGGSKAPEPIKWKHKPRANGGNVMGPLGGYDPDVQKTVLRAADVKKYTDEPPAAEPPAAESASSEPTLDVRARLDAAVLELIEGEPWAFFVVELGIAHEEKHFWRSSETMQTVAMALPHLSPEVREKAVAWLDKLFDSGVPLGKPVLGGDGRRREHYDLAPELAARQVTKPPKYTAEVTDLYAVWAYAHYANRWEKVLPQAPAILEGFRNFFADPPKFDTASLAAGGTDDRDGNAVEDLNRQLAGVIAYVRIAQKAGRADDAKMAAYLLAELATERIHVERADPRLLAGRAHHGTLPRYQQFTPELGRMLADHAGEQLARNLADLKRELPVWYQAWAERLIGGENYITPPGLARGIFLATAYATPTPPNELIRYLDHPWCRADLYYIEKLTAVGR